MFFVSFFFFFKFPSCFHCHLRLQEMWINMKNWFDYDDNGQIEFAEFQRGFFYMVKSIIV